MVIGSPLFTSHGVRPFIRGPITPGLTITMVASYLQVLGWSSKYHHYQHSGRVREVHVPLKNIAKTSGWIHHSPLRVMFNKLKTTNKKDIHRKPCVCPPPPKKETKTKSNNRSILSDRGTVDGPIIGNHMNQSSTLLKSTMTIKLCQWLIFVDAWAYTTPKTNSKANTPEKWYQIRLPLAKL